MGEMDKKVQKGVGGDSDIVTTNMCDEGGNIAFRADIFLEEELVDKNRSFYNENTERIQQINQRNMGHIHEEFLNSQKNLPKNLSMQIQKVGNEEKRREELQYRNREKDGEAK